MALTMIEGISDLASLSVVTGLGAALLVIVWLILRSNRQVDARHPPVVKAKLPVIGHLYGMLKHQSLYFEILSARNPSYPIFSISILGRKIHIIADADLNSALHRSKTLTFEPLVLQFGKRLLGVSDFVLDLNRDVEGKQSPYARDTHNYHRSAMQPGPALYHMNAAVLKNIAGLLNTIGSEGEEKNVWLWIRDTFAEASISAMFGQRHPLSDDSKVIQALWDFDEGQRALMFAPFPSLTARKPFEARALLLRKLEKYYEARCYEDADASIVVKSHAETSIKHGLPLDQLAITALGLVFVSTTNAIPTLYWLLLYVFSSPALVEKLRTEVLSISKKEGDRLTIDPSKFSTQCPLLCSAYQETMRLENVQPGTRVAVEDTILTHTATIKTDTANPRTEYLLEKGSVVQAPASISHRLVATWGPTADIFDAERFMPTNENDEMAERLRKKAYVPFGGGKHLCPGRHFAFAEILGAIAVMVLGFEVEGLDGRHVKVPKGRTQKFSDGVVKPDKEGKEIRLRIRRRDGWEKTVWEFSSNEA